MPGFIGEGIALIMAASAVAGASGVVPAAPVAEADRFPIVELRQYTLHDGKRDTLVDLFEREFVESQEELGLKVIGTFTDLDNPNHFVWIRGFRSMESRQAGLSEFYGGPVWKAHRDVANATMVDSDNVLLLEAPSADAQFALPATRPAVGSSEPAGLVTAIVYYLKADPAEAVPLFAKQVAPQLAQDGVQPLAWFVTGRAANNFPRLPVREGERVLVWFGGFVDDTDRIAHRKAFDRAAEMLAPLLSREPELHRLKPTSRSLVRAAASPKLKTDGARGFDFLHGSWRVKHRKLRQRGIGSNDWAEFNGAAVTKPLLGGLCNIEEHRIPGQDSAGIALRCFDRASDRWSIYWVSQRDGLLQPPVHGSLIGGKGHFEGDDTDGERQIRVRFAWSSLSANSARWEQSFSYDGGATWETNWTMDFNRDDPGGR